MPTYNEFEENKKNNPFANYNNIVGNDFFTPKNNNETITRIKKPINFFITCDSLTNYNEKILPIPYKKVRKEYTDKYNLYHRDDFLYVKNRDAKNKIFYFVFKTKSICFRPNTNKRVGWQRKPFDLYHKKSYLFINTFYNKENEICMEKTELVECCFKKDFTNDKFLSFNKIDDTELSKVSYSLKEEKFLKIQYDKEKDVYFFDFKDGNKVIYNKDGKVIEKQIYKGDLMIPSTNILPDTYRIVRTIDNEKISFEYLNNHLYLKIDSKNNVINFQCLHCEFFIKIFCENPKIFKSYTFASFMIDENDLLKGSLLYNKSFKKIKTKTKKTTEYKDIKITYSEVEILDYNFKLRKSYTSFDEVLCDDNKIFNCYKDYTNS